MDVIAVNITGLALIALIVWYFWLSKPEGTVASITGDGVQETFVVVNGGYTPDTVRVAAGTPVRIVFHRQESDPCSERVILDDFAIAADLPTDTNVPVEFTPEQAGTYEFACQMGMLRGKVIAS